MLNLFGYVSAFAFATVLIPQVIHTLKTKDVSGLSNGFLLLNFIGQVFGIVYVIHIDSRCGTFSVPLYLNYSAGFCCNSILAYLKMKHSKR